MEKIKSEIAKNEKVMLDTSNLTPEHYRALRKAISDEGLQDQIRWWPPELN